MESRIKLLGHPVHPMLIVFPVGLLASAMLFDIAYVLTGNADLATFSFWALVVGIVGGLAAALFGLTDWLAVPKGTRARRIGALHGSGNVVVLVLFGLSLLARLDRPAFSPDLQPLVLSIAGGAIAVVTAWL